MGAEAPIVLTGSAIGSTLGQIFHVDNKRLMLLVGCGAAGAIAGIFKAPIAGLVFTLEVLMVDLTMASNTPNDITVMIGPEGDFSIDEVEFAMSHGFESISLGNSRLRTETAGLSAVMMAQLTLRKK